MNMLGTSEMNRNTCGTHAKSCATEVQSVMGHRSLACRQAEFVPPTAVEHPSNPSVSVMGASLAEPGDERTILCAIAVVFAAYFLLKKHIYSLLPPNNITRQPPRYSKPLKRSPHRVDAYKPVRRSLSHVRSPKNSQTSSSKQNKLLIPPSSYYASSGSYDYSDDEVSPSATPIATDDDIQISTERKSKFLDENLLKNPKCFKSLPDSFVPQDQTPNIDRIYPSTSVTPLTPKLVSERQKTINVQALPQSPETTAKSIPFLHSEKLKSDEPASPSLSFWKKRSRSISSSHNSLQDSIDNAATPSTTTSTLNSNASIMSLFKRKSQPDLPRLSLSQSASISTTQESETFAFLPESFSPSVKPQTTPTSIKSFWSGVLKRTESPKIPAPIDLTPTITTDISTSIPTLSDPLSTKPEHIIASDNPPAPSNTGGSPKTFQSVLTTKARRFWRSPKSLPSQSPSTSSPETTRISYATAARVASHVEHNQVLTGHSSKQSPGPQPKLLTRWSKASSKVKQYSSVIKHPEESTDDCKSPETPTTVVESTPEPDELAADATALYYYDSDDTFSLWSDPLPLTIPKSKSKSSKAQPAVTATTSSSFYSPFFSGLSIPMTQQQPQRHQYKQTTSAFSNSIEFDGSSSASQTTHHHVHHHHHIHHFPTHSDTVHAQSSHPLQNTECNSSQISFAHRQRWSLNGSQLQQNHNMAQQFQRFRKLSHDAQFYTSREIMAAYKEQGGYEARGRGLVGVEQCNPNCSLERCEEK